jgi:6-phosphofructo-2-kinase/fructose-2,6-biphosphatase 2
MINAGERLVINRHCGNLQSRIGYWLLNIHITPRTIYLTRHGESEMNLLGKIGGNSGLSDNGQVYADKLAKYFEENEVNDLRVWTSWFKRTIQTASGIQVGGTLDISHLYATSCLSAACFRHHKSVGKP